MKVDEKIFDSNREYNLISKERVFKDGRFYSKLTYKNELTPLQKIWTGFLALLCTISIVPICVMGWSKVKQLWKESIKGTDLKIIMAAESTFDPKEKKYQRDDLKTLLEKDRNVTFKLSASKDIDFYSNYATIYQYNAEGINDYGWGCAWRAIQTCLSNYDKHIPFNQMFHQFGSSENLKLIFKNKYHEKEITSTKKFAPYDLSNGWAEPFIGQMALHFYGINSDLEYVNAIPSNANAPEEVFTNKGLNFETFKSRLLNHFKKENPSPVMMDDGSYAMNIVGVGIKGNNTTLLIADPHINQGIKNGSRSKIGIYKVTLDEEGKKIHCSLDDEDAHQVPHLFSKHSYEGIEFDSKPWMVLFPIH